MVQVNRRCMKILSHLFWVNKGGVCLKDLETLLFGVNVDVTNYKSLKYVFKQKDLNLG